MLSNFRNIEETDNINLELMHRLRRLEDCVFHGYHLPLAHLSDSRLLHDRDRNERTQERERQNIKQQQSFFLKDEFVEKVTETVKEVMTMCVGGALFLGILAILFNKR